LGIVVVKVRLFYGGMTGRSFLNFETLGWMVVVRRITVLA
jgi:hypothetical protein